MKLLTRAQRAALHKLNTLGPQPRYKPKTQTNGRSKPMNSSVYTFLFSKGYVTSFTEPSLGETVYVRITEDGKRKLKESLTAS